MRTEYAGLVDAKYVGRTVTLFGWVHRRRDHGGVIFIDLRDRSGLVQVVCDPDRADVERLATAGYRAYLIGERFMTDPDPAGAIATLMGTRVQAGT